MKTMVNFNNAQKVFTYDTYIDWVTALNKRGEVTGAEQSPARLEATRINLVRMHRLQKTVVLNPGLLAELQKLKTHQTWYLIVEGWCGDGAQIAPVLDKIAQATENIELKVLLRDQNPDIINAYLTNGNRAIPKLIILDSETEEEIAVWGPRPKKIQDMVKQYKEANPNGTNDDFLKALHLWYARDRGKAVQDEIYQLLKLTARP